MSRLFAVIAAAAALSLGACASAPAVNGVVPAQHVADVVFEVSGRIAVRYADRVDSGNFSWRHLVADDVLSLETPLGQTVAELRRGPEGVALKLADGRSYQAASVETLSADVLGWELPLSGLPYWLRGVPLPGLDSSLAPASASSPLLLTQAGWRVSYPEFSGPPALPARVVLQRDGLEIRLAIHSWNFNP